ncbi:MAG: rhomboid family intramembrane serine protease [Schumannella sp.]|nr:rhomboid family intramembrane serine protease [Microbacteriaceae bacterium]
MSDPGTEEETELAPVCYRHPKRETWIRCQRCERPICTECQTQAAVGVQCPECMAAGRESVARRPGGWARMFRPAKGSAVTYALIGINVVVYVLQFLTGQRLADAWFLYPYEIGSEPWRLITSAFLHSPSPPAVHLLFNMYALFVFGPVLETFLGRIRFIALYLIGALGGSIGYLVAVELWIFTDGRVETHLPGALGASGAVFALLGAVIAMRRPLGVDVRQLLIILGINLALPVFFHSIAWQAHIGGLVVGFAIGLVYMATRRRDARVAQILGVAGIAVALLAIFGAFLASAPAIYF